MDQMDQADAKAGRIADRTIDVVKAGRYVIEVWRGGKIKFTVEEYDDAMTDLEDAIRKFDEEVR